MAVVICAPFYPENPVSALEICIASRFVERNFLLGSGQLNVDSGLARFIKVHIQQITAVLKLARITVYKNTNIITITLISLPGFSGKVSFV